MAQLTGGTQAFMHPTSEVLSTSIPHQVGTRARDKDGNEYVYCDFTGTVYTGTPVLINTNGFTAAKIGTTGRGPFGVATTLATSDESGWVQIYGRCYVQALGDTAGVSPSDAANAITTLSTTLQTKFWLPTTATSTGPEGVRWTSGNTSLASGFYIRGMVVAHDASPFDTGGVTLRTDTSSVSPSNVSPATSHTGHDIAVWLNYPEIVHVNVGE